MKGQKIKLIIFDAYGMVLEGGYPLTCKALAKKYNRNWREVYEILYKKYFNMAATKKITQKDAWVLALKELDLEFDWKEARALHYGFMKINQEVAEFIKCINKNVLTLLLSKNTRSQFSDVEKKLGFKKYFSYTINTWEIGLPKASEKTMRHIMKKFSIKPSEVIYIDDQKENLVAAKNLGVNTVLYESFDKFEKNLKKLLNYN
ncbi:HAD-IA family hydrolase [bacterium]|nr:HAD-IA family hydrolase [bacterium]